MPRYRTTAPHYINDRIIEAETEIGDGTQYPLPLDFPPSDFMVRLDEPVVETPKAPK